MHYKKLVSLLLLQSFYLLFNERKLVAYDIAMQG